MNISDVSDCELNECTGSIKLYTNSLMCAVGRSDGGGKILSNVTDKKSYMNRS